MNTIEQLEQVRQGMLRLHKALLEHERVNYEREHGRVESAGAFLQVVIGDASFDWLHRLSELIVQIDEAQEDDEQPLTDSRAVEFLKQARTLLQPAEGGQGFGGNYFRAMQADPGVAMLHGRVMQSLK